MMTRNDYTTMPELPALPTRSSELLGESLLALFMAVMAFYARNGYLRIPANISALLSEMQRSAHDASSNHLDVLIRSVEIIGRGGISDDRTVRQALSDARCTLLDALP